MAFDYEDSNPDLELERRTYLNNWKNKKEYNGLIFFNNFFNNYFPHNNEFKKKEMISLLQGDFHLTYRDISSKIILLNGKSEEDNLNKFSPLFLTTKAVDFFENINDLLDKERCKDQITSFNGSFWDLVEYDQKCRDSSVNVYFDLRKQGYWRNNDLIT